MPNLRSTGFFKKIGQTFVALFVLYRFVQKYFENINREGIVVHEMDIEGHV